MTHSQHADALDLLRKGCGDEQVEALCGLSLTDIIGLRGGLASAAIRIAAPVAPTRDAGNVR